MKATVEAAKTPIRVPVKLWLTPIAFRVLERAARDRGFDSVGALLESQAERSTSTPPPRTSGAKPRKHYVRMDDLRQMRLVEMWHQGHANSEIAAELGVSYGTVFNRTRKLPPR